MTRPPAPDLSGDEREIVARFEAAPVIAEAVEAWHPEDVQPGDTLLAWNGYDSWEVRALTGMWRTESIGRSREMFPVITVGFTTQDTEGRNWPVEYLRAADGAS